MSASTYTFGRMIGLRKQAAPATVQVLKNILYSTLGFGALGAGMGAVWKDKKDKTRGQSALRGALKYGLGGAGWAGGMYAAPAFGPLSRLVPAGESTNILRNFLPMIVAMSVGSSTGQYAGSKLTDRLTRSSKEQL